MQSQMEAKLANMSLKSPGLKSNLPGSPTARNFSGSHLNNYLSPDSANNLASPSSNDPAVTLAQQRAKLKASNAAHRISAPALASQVGQDGRNAWNATPNQLAQVDEAANGAQEITVPSPNTSASRPKSTDFSGVANALRSPRVTEEGTSLSPMVGDSWASMVNTPLIPMFNKERNSGQSLDAAAAKLNEWAGNGPGVPLMSDPPKRLNRLSKGSTGYNGTEEDNNAGSQHHPNNNQQQQRNVSGGLRNVSGSNNAFGGAGGWNGARSPALSNTSGRFSDDGSHNGMNGLGMAGYGNGLGMGMPGVPGGGINMAALAAAGMSPLGVNAFGNMNMFNMQNMQNLAAMGLSAEQIITMQMAAAAGQLGSGAMNGFGMGMQPQSSPSVRSGRTSMRSPNSSVKSPNSTRDGKKDEEDVDPKVLEDVPAWLRSLRLHKYTPNFEGMHWKDMVMMDEAALEAKGVAALGARRKMMKTFEIVRKKMGVDTLAGAAASA